MRPFRGVFSWIPLLAVCLFSAACGGGGVDAPAETPRAATPAPKTNPDATKARPKVVALGDSLTAGLGLVDSQAYPAILQKRIDGEGYGFEVVNAGVSGDTSAGGVRRLDWALDGDVKVLILALGANDGLRGLSVEDMKQNLTTIVTRARERKVVVILAGMEAPPNYGQEYATAFREAYREIAEREKVLFLPFLLDKVAGQSTLNQGDGIHPNERGSRIVAENIWSVLKPLLDQMTASS